MAVRVKKCPWEHMWIASKGVRNVRSMAQTGMAPSPLACSQHAVGSMGGCGRAAAPQRARCLARWRGEPPDVARRATRPTDCGTSPNESLITSGGETSCHTTRTKNVWMTALCRRFAHFSPNLLKSLDRGFAKSATSLLQVVDLEGIMKMTEPRA